MKSRSDPTVRTYVIHALSPLAVNPQLIALRLDDEPDVTIRRGIVLALGQFTESQLSKVSREPLIAKLLAVYKNEPDAGLHGAAEWVLRKWRQDKGLEAVAKNVRTDESQLRSRGPGDKRQWYVNAQNQTYSIIDARDDWFLMGSRESESHRFTNEGQHRVRLGRRFAISTKEVTREQFAKFQRERPEVDRVDTRGWSKTEDSPQTTMTWYEAASYCNWLSQSEGIAMDQWCYEPNKEGRFAAGMKAKDDHLKRTGYRLPTEAEWEYACRAGTVTSRYYGSNDLLLHHYAWDFENSDSQAWPTGRLEPNDWGLFDMHGNAYEWCFDLYAEYPQQKDKVFPDTPSTRAVEIGKIRVMRGGSFTSRPQIIRSADRDYYPPEQHYSFFGFRPARTMP